MNAKIVGLIVSLWTTQSMAVITGSSGQNWAKDFKFEQGSSTSNAQETVERIEDMNMISCEDENLIPLNMLDHLTAIRETAGKPVVNIQAYDFKPELDKDGKETGKATAKVKVSVDQPYLNACMDLGFGLDYDARKNGNYVLVAAKNNYNFESWISSLSEEDFAKFQSLGDTGHEYFNRFVKDSNNIEDVKAKMKLRLKSDRNALYDMCLYQKGLSSVDANAKGFVLSKDIPKEHFKGSRASEWTITNLDQSVLTEIVYASPRILEYEYRNNSDYGHNGGSKFGRVQSDGSCFQYEKPTRGSLSLIDPQKKHTYLANKEEARLKEIVEELCEKKDMDEIYKELKKGVGPFEQILKSAYKEALELKVKELVAELRQLESSLGSATTAETVEELSGDYMSKLKELKYLIMGPKTDEELAITGPALIDELRLLYMQQKAVGKGTDQITKEIERLNGIIGEFARNETSTERAIGKLLEFGQVNDATDTNELFLISKNFAKVNKRKSGDLGLTFDAAWGKVQTGQKEFSKAAKVAYKEYEARHKGQVHSTDAKARARSNAERGLKIYRDFYSSSKNRELAMGCQRNPQTGQILDASKCRQYESRKRQMLAIKNAYEKRAERYAREGKLYSGLEQEYKEQYKDADGDDEYGYFGRYTRLERGSDFDDTSDGGMGDLFGFQEQGTQGNSFGFSAGGALGSGVMNGFNPGMMQQPGMMPMQQPGMPQQGMMGFNPYQQNPMNPMYQNMAYQQYNPYGNMMFSQNQNPYQMNPMMMNQYGMNGGYGYGNGYGGMNRAPAGFMPVGI